MKLIYLIVLLYSFISLNGYTQILLHQDTYHGGVTVGGLSSGMGSDYTDSLQLHIPTGGSIKKVILFVYSNGFPPVKPIIINGNTIVIDTSQYIMNVTHLNEFASPIKLYSIDLTSFLSNNPTNSFSLSVPGFIENYNWGWYVPILYIKYKHPSMPLITTSLWINNQDYIGHNDYEFTNMNPINTSLPVGLSIFDDRACNTNNDGTVVSLNGSNLGTIGGSDLVNELQACGGAKGHFYYENQTLFGLDDDVPNNSMNGTDALADISGYLNNNSTGYDLTLEHVKYPAQNKAAVNVHLLFVNAYTSPCDTFTTTVTPDTTICQGETLQLHATGGQTYEWTSIKDTSSNDLSCTNCPNPIFTGDSSQVYTVRIWNNDSCSVVRPVRITVSPKVEKSNFDTSPALCGVNNDGAIAIDGNKPTNWDTLWAVTSEGDTLQTSGTSFSNLSKGEYTVFYTNSYGCKSEDTSVMVNSYKNTVLAFTAEPLNGKAPLQVNITNNSHYTDTLIWLLNGEEQLQPFTGFSATTAGEYEVQLIGWQNAKTCADTLGRTIWVYDNTIITVSGAISPNGDGKNDVFYIKNLEKFPGTNVWIYNRWGNLVYHSDNYQNDWSGTSQSQTTIGKGNKLPEGTYYYVIQLGGDVITKKEDRIKEGFFYLKR